MKKQAILLFIFLIFLCTISTAQNTEADSLKTIIESSEEDSLKVDNLIILSSYYYRSAPEKAIRYGNEAKDLAEKINYQKGLGYALKSLGMAYYFQSKYLETIQFWKFALEVFEEYGDTKGAANMLSNIGAIYFNQGDDAKAIDFYLRTLKLAEEIKDSLRIATVLNNIGGVYFNKKVTQDLALNYYLRALDISLLINDQNAIGTSSVNAGGYYLEKKNADSALFYYNKSLNALKQTIHGNVSYALNDMGQAYALKKDFKQAEKYLNEALTLARNNNSSLDITLALISLGNIYNEQRAYEKAIDYFKQAEVLAIEIRANYELQETFEELAQSYATISDYDQAYHYQKLFSEIKDTLYNTESDKKIQRLQFNYDIDKKQGEVDILTKDREIQDLEIRRQRIVKNAFFAGFLLILIIAFILFRSIRNKIKTNKILDKQKMEIENLLLNILPPAIAKELQKFGFATPRHYDSVSVLFTDFKGFSMIAKDLTPNELVSELNEFFIAFDNISEKYNLEKIKTIGDAYMCAGGIPTVNDTHPLNTVMAGLAMQEFMKTNNIKREKEGKIPWGLRVGIHTGPIVAGVVGRKKYAYDIWGSSVNISSRMESNGEVGKLNISEATYELIKDHYHCQHRGKIYAKNIGDIDMYFVEEEKKLTVDSK